MTPVEKYHLARHHAGSRYTITTLLTYPSTSALPAEKAIRYRIMELQDHFPRLSARISTGTENEAEWHEWPTHRGSLTFYSRKSYPLGWTRDDILQDSLEVWTNAYWRVKVYEPKAGEEQEQEQEEGRGRGDGKAYISVSVAHELMDGRGLARLVDALLRDSVDDLQYEGMAPEELDITPSWSFWAPRRFLQLVQDYTPSVITDNLAPVLPPAFTPSWPGERVASDYIKLPARVAFHDLDPQLIESLKSLSRHYGIPTINPVLEMAFIVAVWIVTRPCLPLSIVTPINERTLDNDHGHGHAYCTGQYTSAHLFSIQPEEGTGFWQTTSTLALQLAHPASKAAARMNIGMLHSISCMRAHLESTAASATPFAQRISFSNIGKVDLPRGAEDMVFTGTPSIGDPPFEVVLCGHEGGVKLSTAFRAGAVVSEEEVRSVHGMWEGVLRDLVIDGKERTLGDLKGKIGPAD